MFKKMMIPMVAVMVAVTLAFGISAFKKAQTVKSNFTTLYFHFIPDNGSEPLYESAASWQNVGAPTDPNCPTGSADPCVIEVESSDLPSSVPGIPNPTLEQKLARKISQESNPISYVTNQTVVTKE